MRLLQACLLIALALVGVGSCHDVNGPAGGTLTVSLGTPNPGADGAVLLTVTGPSALTGVTAAQGLRVFFQPLSTTNHFAVTGPLPNGVVLMIGISDVSQAGQYVATIQDVAASDYTLRSLAGYSLAIAK